MYGYEYKLKHRKHKEDFKYLYYSSHMFIISSFLSMIYKRLDICFISSSLLCTSILRWKYPFHKIYIFLDRNWVKVIFFHLIYSLVICCLYMNHDPFILFWCFGLLLTVVILYMVELFIFMNFNTRKGIVLHMLIHIYTMVGFVSCLFLNHDFRKNIVLRFNDRQ